MDLSPKILALVLVVVGVAAVMFISGFQIFDVFSPGISEEVTVILKQNGTCIVEASDNVPRQINNCTYEQGDQIEITFKQEQPTILSHNPI
jgi:hypothetical protein